MFKTKMKNKINAFIQKHKFKVYLFLGILIALGSIQVGNIVYNCYMATYDFISNPVPAYASTKVSVSRTQEPSMKEWVRAEIEKAGLNWEEVDCIIQNESGWNNWNNNWNTNGTIDSGIFMINSVHKNTISLEDRYNYKTATKWAINKRLHDGNWSAWVASKKCK